MKRAGEVNSCLAALMLWACNVGPGYGDMGATPVDSARNDSGFSARDLALAPADLAGLCGEPIKLAAYGRCMAASDESSCLTAGGTWSTGHIFDPRCLCPTGQDKCSCTKFSDCLAGCVTTEYPCPAVLHGRCADSSIGGCFCTVDGNGLPAEICIN